MKMNNFRGDLTDILAKKEALVRSALGVPKIVSSTEDFVHQGSP